MPTSLKPTPPPLPPTREGLDARSITRPMTPNQHALYIMRTVWPDADEFRSYCGNAWDEDAKTGSVTGDTWMAARLFQEIARTDFEGSPLSTCSLKAARKSMLWAWKKHQLTKKQRRLEALAYHASAPNGNGHDSA